MSASKIKLPVDVMIWTSSHGNPHHFFPEALQKEYEMTIGISDYLQLPDIDARGGRLMDDKFMSQIESDLTHCNPEMTRLNIVLMGDNDIRTHGEGGGFRVFNNTKKLIKMHQNTGHALLLMGQMPSPATHAQTSSISDYADFRVQNEIEKLYANKEPEMFENLGFVRTSLFFDDDQGFLDHEAYFKPDRIHLSPRGARVLAENMIKHALSFIKLISDF